MFMYKVRVLCVCVCVGGGGGVREREREREKERKRERDLGHIIYMLLWYIRDVTLRFMIEYAGIQIYIYIYR